METVKSIQIEVKRKLFFTVKHQIKLINKEEMMGLEKSSFGNHIYTITITATAHSRNVRSKILCSFLAQ